MIVTVTGNVRIFEKNEVPDTLNGFLVKYEDATMIIPDSTLQSSTVPDTPYFSGQAKKKRKKEKRGKKCPEGPECA